MTIALTRLGSVLPEPDEPVDIEQLTDAFGDVDANVGAVVSASLAAIATPYEGQIAYAEDVDRLYVYVNAQWILLAVKAANNQDTKMTTPAGTPMVAITDDAGGFQVGSDNSDNIQFTGTQIQSRDNNVAQELLINPLGGDVQIGPIDGSSGGLTLEYMKAVENTNTTDQTVSATDWTMGENAADVNCVAPPSGRVMVIASAQFTTDSSSDTGFFGFTIYNGGTEFLAPGGQGRSAIIQGNVRIPVFIVDIVGGLTPGTTYRFRTAHKRNSGDAVAITWRKILVQPIY